MQYSSTWARSHMDLARAEHQLRRGNTSAGTVAVSNRETPVGNKLRPLLEHRCCRPLCAAEQGCKSFVTQLRKRQERPPCTSTPSHHAICRSWPRALVVVSSDAAAAAAICCCRAPGCKFLPGEPRFLVRSRSNPGAHLAVLACLSFLEHRSVSVLLFPALNAALVAGTLCDSQHDGQVHDGCVT